MDSCNVSLLGHRSWCKADSRNQLCLVIRLLIAAIMESRGLDNDAKCCIGDGFEAMFVLGSREPTNVRNVNYRKYETWYKYCP